MPYLFTWDTHDHRQVGWSPIAKDRTPLCPEKAWKGLSLPEFVPDSKYWPLKFRQVTKHKTFPDFGRLTFSNTLLVNKRARSLIEDLEPIQHIFVPIELNTHAGDIIKNQYWLFRMAKFIDDGLILEGSDINKMTSPIDNSVETEFYASTTLLPKLIWDTSKIKNRHIWADKFLSRKVCISDEFAKIIQREKFKYFHLTEGGEM